MIESAGMQKALLNIEDNKVNGFSTKDTRTLKKEELMEAARQFESVFLNKMMQTMHNTIEKDGFFSGGRGEEMFKSMLNQEFANEISSGSKNFGFAQQMYEQMEKAI